MPCAPSIRAVRRKGNANATPGRIRKTKAMLKLERLAGSWRGAKLGVQSGPVVSSKEIFTLRAGQTESRSGVQSLEPAAAEASTNVMK